MVRVRWVMDGQEKTSSVHYNRASAEHRQQALTTSGAAAVEIFETTRKR